MCNFLSALVLRNGDILTHPMIDSHSELVEHFKVPDATHTHQHFAKVELSPVGNEDDDWLDVSRWRFRLDEEAAPVWWEDIAERVERSLRDRAARMILTSGDHGLIVDGCWIVGGTAKIREVRSGRIMRLCKGGTVSAICGGTVSEIRGGTVSAICGGTVSEIRGGTVSAIWGGTVSEIWGGTVSEIRGGTVSEICGGTVSAIRGGTVSEIWGGTVSAIWGGTVSAIWGGTVSEIRGGTVSAIRGGTVSAIRGGTVSEIRGGTVSEIRQHPLYALVLSEQAKGFLRERGVLKEVE